MTDDKMTYRFRLRVDMPVGFKQNDEYPELPAIFKYLQPRDGIVYTSPEQFQDQVLSLFPDYLEQAHVPEGPDPKLREGLQMDSVGEDVFDVFTPSSSSAGKCVFGYLGTDEALEKIFETIRGKK